MRNFLAAGFAVSIVAMSCTTPHAAVSAQFASNPPPSRTAASSLDYRVFKSWCEADPSQADNWQVQLGYCIGYLQGLYWGQVISSPVAERPFCLPNDLQKADMIDALDEYASSHPQELASVNMTPGETASLVAKAFKAHFICP